MTTSRERFIDLMKTDILKLDLADLDFGIYRILNHRRDEIEEFFDVELPAVLDRAMTGTSNDDAVFAESEEDHLYNALYTFFSRYYRDGDFQPQQRRANDARYSVPYNGEDVHFHWRSKGSHYIKTTEELKSYSFRSGGWRVRFEFVEAFQEPDNVKGTSRYFVPVSNECRVDVGDEGNLFIVPFAFRKLTIDEDKRYGKKTKTIDGDSTQERLINDVGDNIDPPDGVTKTDLIRHMQRYARKNRTDYFVHPHLGEFLRGELEYYLKNEFLDIEALTSSDAISDRLQKMRAVRDVANRIIDMLDEIELFQARLFEKRRFVLSSSYLVPVWMVPEGLWGEVLENKEQRAQWRTAFGLTGRIGRKTLETHPTLVVDTSLFGPSFQHEILEAPNDLGEVTDGLAISSENLAALRTVMPLIRGSCAAVYIDPPYNTGQDGFLYKDDFHRHSTWLTFMSERVLLGRELLTQNGLMFVSIGHDELERLRLVFEQAFGSSNVLPPLIWNRRHSQQQGLFKEYHEYVLGASRDLERVEPFIGGEGVIVAGAMKKVSVKNPALDFAFPAGVRCEAPDGTELAGRWGDAEWVELVSGRFVVADGLLQEEVTLRAGWTQANQMREYFSGKDVVLDTRGQQVLEFYFTSTGKLKVLKQRGRVTPSTILDTYGTQGQSSADLANILGRSGMMSYPKPAALVRDLVGWPTGQQTGMIADYFAGSGTTAEAVMSLNRADGGSRRFTVVDMEEYFRPVLLQRIIKIMYAPEWKDGVPAEVPEFGGDVPDWVERSPRLVHVIELESYEDSLNSLVVDDDDRLGGEHRIRYAIPDSVDESPTFLSTERLENPFDYQIEVHTDEGIDYRDVDLVTTFNLIKGIHPKRFREINHDGRRYVVIESVDSGDSMLVIWRSVAGLEPEAERDFLEVAIREALGTELSDYDTIWHNADSVIPNSMSLDAEFKRLMFEPELALS